MGPRRCRRPGEGDPARESAQESLEDPGRPQPGLCPGPDQGEATGGPHLAEFTAQSQHQQEVAVRSRMVT